MGAAAQEDDGEPFDQKMARLTATLSDQFAESHRLEATIRQNLAGLGCPLKTPRLTGLAYASAGQRV